eukprot:TRINITY_DN855_c0_g1_i2.p1 TRINITY_DN855_c0_g1~~TRINITY_DN855_c0_g1_i2.p1  ORF type:complete len:180 (-),score=14.26 TRINITY_DN855_c0_g1_i2:96-635(-)
MLCNDMLRGPNDVHDSIRDCEATLALFEKGLKFVREYRQRIPVKPLDKVVQRWAPQHVFLVEDVNIRTSEATLSSTDLFGQFGDIKRIRFLYRQNAGSQNSDSTFTGKCLVHYQSYVDLDPMAVILMLDGCVVDGHTIRVQISSKSKKQHYQDYNQQRQHHYNRNYYDQRHYHGHLDYP